MRSLRVFVMREQRVERILQALEHEGLSQMLIVDPMSVYYLTDYYNLPYERFFGLLLRKDGQHVLFLNKLFYAPVNSGVKEVWFSDTDPVAEVLAPYLMRDAVLGVDKELTARFLLPLMEKKAAAGFVNSSLAVDKTRGVKDAEEQEKMRRASDINDAAMAKFRSLVHEGVTERAIAEGLLGEYRRLGAEDHSFTPIVSFGANAADPHHEPDDTVLHRDDMVLFDVGCRRDWYCSDMTRTFFTAQPTARQLEVYDTVRRANEAAEAIVRPGVTFAEIDLTARRIIEDAGYGPYFTHRLGHQIGLTDHEPGDVSSTHDEPVQVGQCFSIEPGIYLPGDVGVRIEDLIIVTEDGCEVLNSYPKGLTVLG